MMLPLPCEPGKHYQSSRVVNSHEGDTDNECPTLTARWATWERWRYSVNTALTSKVKFSLHSASGPCHLLKMRTSVIISFARQFVHFTCVSVMGPVREST